MPGFGSRPLRTESACYIIRTLRGARYAKDNTAAEVRPYTRLALADKKPQSERSTTKLVQIVHRSNYLLCYRK